MFLPGIWVELILRMFAFVYLRVKIFPIFEHNF